MGGRISDDSINVFKVATGGTGQSYNSMSSQQSCSVSKLGDALAMLLNAITDGFEGVLAVMYTVSRQAQEYTLMRSYDATAGSGGDDYLLTRSRQC